MASQFPSAGASSSSAAISYGPYDVFINHRGPDVKNTFAGHLYYTLKSKGLQVFLDRPELQAGHNISDQIKAAIEVASVHIAIFSERYAESKWCLEELVLMLNSRGTILPVFYNVDPADLRWSNKRKYAEDLQKHEKDQRYDWQKIQGWKKALSSVAGISGFELKACNGDEVELLDQVVQRVLKEVPKPPLFVAKYKIGLQEKIKDFERTTLSRLEGEDTLEAKVVGIVGLGGIGKSTLAKEFFNEKRSNYNGSSFLFDVRESAAQKVLHSLQKKLIKDLVGRDITIDSWEEGVGILENNLKSCKALIILDDVDHRYQLDAFLPVKSVLHPTSLILVTSRNKRVFQSVCPSIYQLKGLDQPNSSELFCSHAFCRPHPPPKFKDLVDGFLKACDGLPLSLQVFGSLLCQEDDRSYWEEQLNGLQNLPDDIQKRLKISYNSLSEEEQQIFLDIACFSLGEDKDKWIKIWGWSGWKGSIGFRNLENKCLVDVDECNEIKMHDHLRDMGRSIAQDPSLPRRLWHATPKDVYDLLEQSSFSVIEVRGIIMAPRWTLEEGRFSDHWEEESFSDKVFRISKLQLLEGWGDFVEGILTKVRSPNLRWLRWFDCPCSSLPSCIPMGDLRYLKVKGHRLERLESEPHLQLRELHISGPLLEFPNSLCHLPYLQKISLSSCTRLQVLPNAIWALMNVPTIDLSYCKNLKRLPNFSENLSNVHTISLRNCESLEALPDSIENLRNLREIDLEGCKSLKDLPNSIENLTNLQNIELGSCTSLEVLPNAIGALMNHQKIDLSWCVNLKRLPNFSENLSNVHTISLSKCRSLEALPDSIENLRNLREIDLWGCDSLEVLPNAIGALMNLQKINLFGCVNLKRLPNFSENLSNVHSICLSNCRSLAALPDSIENLRNLREISLKGCISLQDLPNSIENLTNLQNINLKDCTSLEVLPNAIGALMNLQKINLSGWVNLKRLPNFSENLSNVHSIRLRGCKSLEALPDSIENLRNLREIDLSGCRNLEVLPNAIGALMNLEKIVLTGCVNLKALPNNFGNLTNLTYIDASHSSNLQMPSNFLGNLLQLTHLHLSCCSCLIVSNETLGNITTLECLELSGCLQIEVLPLQVLQQRSLKMLNLLSTNIRELPSAPPVWLNNLEFMILGSPLLKVLPPWLGYLENLKCLLLHGCQKLKCLPDSIGQCSQMRYMEISKCGIQYLPDSVMQLNNLEILKVRGCPLRELPFKNLEGRQLDSSIGRGMNGLCEMHLHLTEISEVSFPVGVCPNLDELKISWCNDLVEVGALPTTLEHLDLKGCGALTKVGGLCGLAQLEWLDIRGCCALKVEELAGPETVISMDTLRPILASLEILKTQLETYDPDEEEEEQMKTAALDSGDLPDDGVGWWQYRDQDKPETPSNRFCRLSKMQQY